MNALPRIRDFDDPRFDPHAAVDGVFGHTIDPHSPLAAARRISPVFEGSVGGVIGDPAFGSLAKPGQREFLILGHADVLAVASDAEAFPNGPALADNLKLSVGNSLSVLDPPDHGPIRRIFQAAFTPKTIAGWKQHVALPVIDALLDGFATRDGGDIVAGFAREYPFRILYRLLDLPAEDAAIFHKLSIAIMFVGGDAQHKAIALEASRKLRAYFEEMVRIRHDAPGDDLVSILAHAQADGERLPGDMIVSFLIQLINAGGETTFQATSSLLAALLTHADQLEAVRRDRALVPRAIDELLRWEPPSAIQPRYVARDVTISGVAIPAGSLAALCFGAASRDEHVFADPDSFDIFRERGAHLGFGYGPHFCIGHHLARMEMKTALNAVLDRLPGLRLDPAAPPPVITGNTQRHARSVHVKVS